MAHELLVLGAGHDGLAAHHARERSLDLRVTLVNAAPAFVERVRPHQVAAGRQVGVHPLTESLAGAGIDLIIGRVHDLDTDALDGNAAGAVRTHHARVQALTAR